MQQITCSVPPTGVLIGAHAALDVTSSIESALMFPNDVQVCPTLYVCIPELQLLFVQVVTVGVAQLRLVLQVHEHCDTLPV